LEENKKVVRRKGPEAFGIESTMSTYSNIAKVTGRRRRKTLIKLKVIEFLKKREKRRSHRRSRAKSLLA